MSTTKHDNKYNVRLNDVVQIVLVILKLCNLINWSWWLVLIPTWVSLGFLAIQGIVFMTKYKTEIRTKEQEWR